MSAAAPWPTLRRGLVAILRGVKPDEVVDIGHALAEAGFEAVEVPLNSPDPFRSIERIAAALPQTLVGAGTVLAPADVDRLRDAGGRLLVSPNIDAQVMQRAASLGLVTMPGVFTPTEALLAVASGASALKFFPASVLGASGIGAIRAVLPADTVIGAVGGVAGSDFETYRRAGASVFGLGSSIYSPGMAAGDVASRARDAVAAWDALGAPP